MYKKCNYIILIFYCILITTLFSANNSALQFPYIEEYRLDNGMRILISPNYDYPTVYCHLYFNYGRVDDTLYGGKLAENTFGEMLKGTSKYPKKGQIKEKLRSFGDDGGRFDTNFIDDIECEIGSYFLKEDIKPAIEFYAELIQNPIFPLRGSVWKKITYKIIPTKVFYNKWGLSRMHLADLYRNVKSTLHPKFHYKLKKRDLKNWHMSHIQPEKITLMITGDVNYIYVKKIINDYFGGWSSSAAIPERPTYNNNIDEKSGIKVRFVSIEDLPDSDIRIVLKSASINDDWYFPSQLAKTVFSSDHLGRLATIYGHLDKYGELKQKSSISLPFNWTRIEGNIKYNNLSEFYDLIISEFSKMSESSINEPELQSAKIIRSNEIKFSLYEPENYTKFIQRQYNINGFNLEKIKSSFDEINKVSLDEINNAASRIYDPNNFILLVMGNQDSCATFLENFEDVEYYKQTEELR